MWLSRVVLIGGILIGLAFVATGLILHALGFVWVGVVWVGLATIPAVWSFLSPEWQERLKADRRNRSLVVMGLMGVLFSFGLGMLVPGLLENDLARIVFGGAFALFPAAIVANMLYDRQGFERAWSLLADQTRLTFEKEPYRLVGTYRGRVIRLDMQVENVGVDVRGRPREVTYMRITVSVKNPSRSSLVVKKRGLVGRFLESEGIQIGYEDFDRGFTIECEPEHFATRLFVFPSLRERLMQVPFVDIELEGQQLRYRRSSVLRNREKLQALFDLMSDLANAVEAYS